MQPVIILRAKEKIMTKWYSIIHIGWDYRQTWYQLAAPLWLKVSHPEVHPNKVKWLFSMPFGCIEFTLFSHAHTHNPFWSFFGNKVFFAIWLLDDYDFALIKLMHTMDRFVLKPLILPLDTDLRFIWTVHSFIHSISLPLTAAVCFSFLFVFLDILNVDFIYLYIYFSIW